MNAYTLLARIILCAILSTAACAKLINPESFQASLESFELFPTLLTPLLSRLVPLLEIFTALLLILKNKALQGALVSCALSIGFVTSLSWGIITKSVKDCGCFGDWELAKVSPEIGLLRATLILTLSALLVAQLHSKMIKK